MAGCQEKKTNYIKYKTNKNQKSFYRTIISTLGADGAPNWPPCPNVSNPGPRRPSVSSPGPRCPSVSSPWPRRPCRSGPSRRFRPVAGPAAGKGGPWRAGGGAVAGSPVKVGCLSAPTVPI
jgi:hypothetical protein